MHVTIALGLTLALILTVWHMVCSGYIKFTGKTWAKLEFTAGCILIAIFVSVIFGVAVML